MRTDLVSADSQFLLEDVNGAFSKWSGFSLATVATGVHENPKLIVIRSAQHS